jgi:hypothetical protein
MVSSWTPYHHAIANGTLAEFVSGQRLGSIDHAKLGANPNASIDSNFKLLIAVAPEQVPRRDVFERSAVEYARSAQMLEVLFHSTYMTICIQFHKHATTYAKLHFVHSKDAI